ncbi:hypothetical protein [Prosthecobacter sp.]|uniref:hypothetical protein n=1 Tax=Prosthecobacter sp. TaxID=1965333 RepID=UPI0037833B3E
MSTSSRILTRFLITLVFALGGAGFGVMQQTSPIIAGKVEEVRSLDKPQQFRSMAKLVAGREVAGNDSSNWREQQADFYGTILETCESAEMKSRALERVRALNPDLKDSDVDIRVSQSKGSSIFNILATGTDPKYTRIFLDALLDEFIAFRQSIREAAQGRVLQQFLQEVVTKQKDMETSEAALEKVRAKVDTPSVKAELERLVTRLNSLRNQRDDLRLKIKPLEAADATKAPLQSQLEATESEIQGIETDLKRYESDLAELRTLTEKHRLNTMAYEKLFHEVEKIQVVFNSASDYVAIQERATPASEHVAVLQDPFTGAASGGVKLGGVAVSGIVIGGVIFGLAGAFIGLLLSLLLIRAPRPQAPAAL